MLTHNRFTLINRNAEAMIDFCKSKGMAVFNAAPYGGGVMAKGTAQTQKYSYRPAAPDVMDALQQVEAICARHGVPVGAAALQFSMRDPRISSTVLGVTRPEQVRQSIEWAEFPVPEAIWDELKAVPFSRKNPQA
jgi:D-threo-aldose 1-dehydrogenase